MDPGRTRPPPLAGDADPRDAWAAYALDAQLMCVREDGSGDWSAPPGLTLRDWVRGADGRPAAAAPTADDLTTTCPRCSRRCGRAGTSSCG